MRSTHALPRSAHAYVGTPLTQFVTTYGAQPIAPVAWFAWHRRPFWHTPYADRGLTFGGVS
eukprot:43408-Pyramimonas_sp.AAC.1